ncbi:MAG: glutathione S-transferase N-terminal domain-containing protein [Lautropia sp.]|nr:glutathione S-transferase N-terminal domain-containing protein [Lautropia sp.]
MLKLHYLPGACSFVPHVALAWSGLPYEAVAETRDSIKSPAYLAKHPQGSVPLLEDGDWALSQNMAILDYLNDLAPKAGIFGHGDRRSVAKARQWLAFANGDLHKLFGPLFAAARFIDGEQEQAALAARARENIVRLFGVVNEALAGKEYLTGELTIADVYVYIIMRWANALKLDLSQHANLAPYFARIEKDAGVQTALKEQGLV